MTFLALLRHAETDWNAEGRIQGRTDVPLNAAGRAEAGSWVVPVEMDDYLWIASPLRRAMETATILTGTPPPADRRLVEMDWGEWEGRTAVELDAELGDALAANEARGLDLRPPGGESPRLVMDRVRPLLGELAERGKPIMAVSHKGVLRAIYAAATGWDMTGEPSHKLLDGRIQLFDLEPDGTPRVERLNIGLAA